MNARPLHFAVVGFRDAWQDLADLLCSLSDNCSSLPTNTLSAVLGHCEPVPHDPPRNWPPVAMNGWAVWTQIEENRGYGAALNRLIRTSTPPGADWVIACNADLTFPPGSIDTLRELIHAAGPDVGLMAPRLLDSRVEKDTAADPSRVERTQPSLGRFPTLANLLLGRLRPRRTRKYIRNPAGPCDIDWATGACLAIRRTAFESIGGFDESFFLDYEDVDLCRRLALAGWRRRYEPEWLVVHRDPNAQRAPGDMRRLHTRASLMRYVARHRRRWEMHALGLMYAATIALRRHDHPAADGWRAGYDVYRQARHTGR